MTALEKKMEEDSIKFTLQEIDSEIIDATIRLEMLKATKVMAESRMEYLKTLN